MMGPITLRWKTKMITTELRWEIGALVGRWELSESECPNPYDKSKALRSSFIDMEARKETVRSSMNEETIAEKRERPS
jgi:hypothetical protein